MENRDEKERKRGGAGRMSCGVRRKKERRSSSSRMNSGVAEGRVAERKRGGAVAA